MDVREFRQKIAKEHGKKAASPEVMQKFAKYRKEKYGESAGKRESFEKMKGKFGEMKFNMSVQKKK